jgi:hypothetical protein
MGEFVPVLLGWLLGVVLGGILALLIRVGTGLPIPEQVAFLNLPFALWIALILAPAIYLKDYVFATKSIAKSLPVVTFPLTAPVAIPAGIAIALPMRGGELIARSKMIGLTATLNAALLSFVPVVGPVLALFAFAVVSLAAVPRFARHSSYQGVLGWSSWLLPLSYPATLPGFLLFVVNAPFAFFRNGFCAFRIDWHLGVLETAGGLVGLDRSAAGFSLGNFNFVTSRRFQGSFSAPSVSSHEAGHTLNTAALGGIVLWINAIDENLRPLRRLNLAYGELLAESHTMALPGTPRAEYFVRFWG